MELAEWTDIVKTARFKELVPYDPDWYYVRAASMARKIYFRGGLGVGAFRRIYGGNKRNGSRPPHFCESSGAIARHILQQLQNMNIIETDPKGGRRITSSGQMILTKWLAGLWLHLDVRTARLLACTSRFLFLLGRCGDNRLFDMQILVITTESLKLIKMLLGFSLQDIFTSEFFILSIPVLCLHSR